MDKIPLAIHKSLENSSSNGTLGMDYYIDGLKNSGLYDISYHDEFISTARDSRGTLFHVGKNKHRVYIDFWEYPTPTYTTNAYNANFDLVVKLQDTDVPDKRFLRYTGRKKLFRDIGQDDLLKYRRKVIPWSFFPSRIMMQYVGKEDQLWGREKKQKGFFCGKSWNCRSQMKILLEAQGIEIINSNQERRSGRPLSDKEYIEKMASSEFGIVLAGRSTMITDPKNRREIDYMMMKVPLLLNYKPWYYNKLEHGKHYVYIDKDTRLDDIPKEYDLAQIAENAYEWYVDNATPYGLAATFKKMMQDHFNEL